MYSRLTTATMYKGLMNSLQQSQRNIQDLQNQIASGNKYTKLSDNPAAISKSLNVQSALTANNKYQSNTENAVTMLRHADSALNNVLDAAQTIKNLIIEAGDGALNSSQLKDITAQIEANKKIMLDNLNTKIAGKYIFGGTDTSTPPFAVQPDGSIVYQGNDERMKYAVSESVLGDISFAGSDIIPEDQDSYFICSHNVPIDWKWTGREEKVQITVGSRTLSVFIPEDWSDNDVNKTNAENTVNYSDDNGFRDPNEVSGISLEDLATIVNRSLEEQGADMLVKAYIERDYESGTQQLFLKSTTGEKIGITGWPDTDYMPMSATVVSADDLDQVDWKSSDVQAMSGMMGITDVSGWSGNSDSGTLRIVLSESYDSDSDTPVDVKKEVEFNLSECSSINDLVNKINAEFPANDDGTKFASLSDGKVPGRLVLRTDKGVISTYDGDDGGHEEIFGYNNGGSSASSITVSAGDGGTPTTIYINGTDELDDVAYKISLINGVHARSAADGKSLVITAERIGDSPEDRLNVDEAQEALHYPSLTVKASGGAIKMFNMTDKDGNLTWSDTTDDNGFVSYSTKVNYQTRLKDQSHIDIFDYLGMETATKSREFDPKETLKVEDGTQLHWRITSGGRSVDLKLNSGEYKLEYIAERLQNATSGWLEVTIEPGGTDEDDDWGRNTDDFEAQTQRLVIRGYNAEQVVILDMNEYNYSDQLGISTVLRTDSYSDTDAGRGMKCVNFPSAPCVDDNIGVPMRVQMNCGMYYDVNIKRADVVDPETGFVNRAKLMQSIVNQVNEQEGHEIMGFVQHINSTGEDIDGSCSMYFLSGEAFTVVDMPFNDPVWGDYSSGLATQMGIHGGISSNMRQNHILMRDDTTFGDAYANESYEIGNETIESNPDSIESGTFREGTIRFSNLAYSVDIDVSADDTVKDVMDRLRVQAGDWLYVNYYDNHMGQSGRNAGDFPLISISSKDGSAVNVLDIKGHIAEDALGISTGIQGRLNPDGTGEGIMAFEWDIEGQTFPDELLNITVAGYTHTLDLTALRDVTNDDEIKANDVVEFINARMQDYDVQALINDDNELVVYSPRGYSVQIEFTGGEGKDMLGTNTSNRTFYRGGYNLEGKSYDENNDGTSRGIESSSYLYGSGVHTQNETIRSGANTMRQNGFGVINDIMAAIESGNRDDLLNKMLPKMDEMMNNILAVMAEDGALQARYNYNTERLVGENAIMTEEYDNLVKIDPADAISQLMIADYMYQANLAVIARLIQPSLLDFLG